MESICDKIIVMIKEKAREIGFELVGIAPMRVYPEFSFFSEWVKRGYNGDMDYLERRKPIDGMKSVIVCGLNYYSSGFENIKDYNISRYAWGEDYHKVIKQKLRVLLRFLESVYKKEILSKIYVDSGPLLERIFGKYAGLGFIGKNTCLINKGLGSWFFLGEILVNLELEYDEPDKSNGCENCRLCIDACPTGAIVEPYVLDARKCISYLTIEKSGETPLELREKIGNNIFGCDICQEICPWNQRSKRKDIVNEFLPKKELNSDLIEIFNIVNKNFDSSFAKSPIRRIKKEGMLRNILIAMGNSGKEKFIPYIKNVLQGEKDEVLRTTAEWAILSIEEANK